MKATVTVLCLTPIALAWLVWRPSPEGQDVLTKIEGYRRWTKVTKEPVDMQPTIALLCSVPPQYLAGRDNPHVPKLFLVYVNSVGRSSMLTKSSPNFPTGSVIVKEKYDRSKVAKGKRLPEAELLTVMVKGKAGSSPATGDWTFFVTDGKGEKLLSGDSATCIKCHAEKKSDDWVFRAY